MYVSCTSLRLFKTVVSLNKRQTRHLKFVIMSHESSTSAELQVEHDVKQNEFFVKLSGVSDDSREKAVLQYAWLEPNTADLHHTEVPPVFRGKGIAKHLAKAALDYMVEKDAKMILSCTYLQKYVKDNPLPEYTSRVIGPEF